MTTSSTHKKYPSRLYEEGKCPLQYRSMNHNCHLAGLQMVEESVGLDAWESIKASSVGVIIRLKEMDYTWSAQVVHHLLANQLVVDNLHELWSAIEGQPIRFSLYEFGEITGLNCEPFDINDKVEVDHKAFWEEIGVSPSHGPMLSELRELFPRIRNWSFEKRRMIGWLCVLSIGILGISPGSRIPLKEAKRVLDAEAFERYPWGRVGFSSLVNSVKLVSYEGKKKYTLRGCVHALLIWVYESIPGIGHEYGNHIEGNQVPLLSWSASRPRVKKLVFYKKERKAHQKVVRVRHLIVKAESDIYPQWDDDKVDDDLHNLILDILHDQLDDKYWSLKATNEPVAIKKQRKLVTEEDDCMKKKIQRRGKSHLNSGGDDGFMHDLMEAVKTLTATVQNVDTVVAEKVLTTLDTKIEAKVNARVAQAEQVLGNQILALQEQVAKITEQMQANAPKNDAHIVNQEDESWMVQDKTPFDVDAAVQCVVRKKAKKSEVKLTSPILLDTVGDSVTRKNQVKEPAGGLINVKKEKNGVPQLRDSAETWSDLEDKQKYDNLGTTLDQLAASILEGPLHKRKPQLTKTQVYPYVGNSTVKRIITGDSECIADCDPLTKVEETKFKKLMDYLRSIALFFIHFSGDNDVDTHFYMKLITPRDLWKKYECGWLTDSHMASAMLMFHKRSMRNPSPYSSRIAFLDHWFVNTWVRDYKKYDPKTWKFSDTYKKVFNGNYPEEFSNNRKWLKDVDRLFLCHLINGNHWVALEVDLDKKIIHVYDSIQTVVPSITDLLEECRPFTKMIPLLLNEMVPERKESSQQFRISRPKSVPKNEDPGDCGVYALKYIECKAVGCGFEGLSDQCILAMRIKLAAEIYDEVSDL
uniref:Ubiquitin-like protease family profile domain-containing protein n=1 Tax=Brassica oleracea TaxID=3712 RepID=A0A3P6DSS5_BRAOL|nr:unnamed protein product [Brassica oleracea]